MQLNSTYIHPEYFKTVKGLPFTGGNSVNTEIARDVCYQVMRYLLIGVQIGFGPDIQPKISCGGGSPAASREWEQPALLQKLGPLRLP